MNDRHDARFDDTVRTHHAAAVERISPRVRAQLAQRRNAALRGTSAARRGHGLRYAAAGFAALGALAIGLRFGVLPSPSNPIATPSVATASTVGAAGSATMLDEDPDFYAWLDSSDARLVATE